MFLMTHWSWLRVVGQLMHKSAGSTFKLTVLLNYYRPTTPLGYKPPSGGFLTPASKFLNGQT
jgi:hypothetical protein